MSASFVMRGVRLGQPSRRSESLVAATQNRISLCSDDRCEALGAAAGPVRARGGGCRVFHCGFRHPERERIASGPPAVDGLVLHILGEQQSAALRLGGADNQAVPPVQTIAPLELSGAHDDIDVDGLWVPREQFMHIVPNVIRWYSRLGLASQSVIALVQYLHAGAPGMPLPQAFQPLLGNRLLQL